MSFIISITVKLQNSVNVYNDQSSTYTVAYLSITIMRTQLSSQDFTRSLKIHSNYWGFEYKFLKRGKIPNFSP